MARRVLARLATWGSPLPRLVARRGPLAGAIASCSLLLSIACGESTPEATLPKVAVAHPVEREVLEWDDYTGRLEATNSVEVRARVSGYLQSVAFRPGQIVDAGALLFVIDPRPYQAELDRAKAAAAQSRSALELARNEARRAGRLVERKAISQEEYEARTAGLRNAEAELQGADAAVRTAQLDLEFTQIRSPIRGRVSRDLVNVGNLVNGGSAGATLLTTVVSLDPIHCYFEVDERAVLKYTDLAAVGRRASSRDAPNPVLLQVADEDGLPARRDDGLRRQRDRSLDRHPHGPRDLPEPRPQAFPGALRARSPDRERQVPRDAAARRRDRHRPGRALRVRRRRREQGRAQEGRTRPDDRGVPHRPRAVSRPPTASWSLASRRCTRARSSTRRTRRSRSPSASDRSSCPRTSAFPIRPAPRRSAGPAMNISRFFIDRPIFATVLSIVIVIVGRGRLSARCRSRSTPTSCRRRSVVNASYPGANAQVVSDTVATPIEQEVNGVEDMLYMSSQCTSDGSVYAHDHVPARHRPRHRAGAGAEPRRHRRAAPPRGGRGRSASPRARARPTSCS